MFGLQYIFLPFSCVSYQTLPHKITELSHADTWHIRYVQLTVIRSFREPWGIMYSNKHKDSGSSKTLHRITTGAHSKSLWHTSDCMGTFRIVLLCHNSKYGTIHSEQSHNHMGTVIFEAAMAWFQILFWCFPWGTEENHENNQSG
jgi:hypothetical protein